MHIPANVGACLSPKGELAQEHLQIRYMQFIETAACLSVTALFICLFQSCVVVITRRIRSLCPEGLRLKQFQG
jgi:hypothetical protein